MGADTMSKVGAAAKQGGKAEQAASPDAHLTQARRKRKETDVQLQAMLNRVTFLQSEEAKIDRDIENMRRRAAELLARQAQKTKDEDILSTAKDVLNSMSTDTSKPRTKGLSALRASIASVPSTTNVAAAPPVAATVSAPPPAVASAATPRITKPPAGPTARASSAQRARPPAGTLAKATSLDASKTGRRPLSGTSASPSKSPDRPASGSSRSTAAATVGSSTASSRAPSPASGKLPTSSSRPGSGTTKAAAGTAPFQEEVVASSPEPAAAAAKPKPTALSGSELVGVDVHVAKGDSENRMAVVGGGTQTGEVSTELLEQLLEGQQASSSGAGGMEGFQQFSTQDAARVVQVRATSIRRQDSQPASKAVVGGVGWGLPTATSGQPLVPTKQLQAELAKKQSLWKVRKTFGLEPAPLHDKSAQVVEFGAGAWG